MTWVRGALDRVDTNAELATLGAFFKLCGRRIKSWKNGSVICRDKAQSSGPGLIGRSCKLQDDVHPASRCLFVVIAKSDLARESTTSLRSIRRTRSC
jgi:hypothetical protein